MGIEQELLSLKKRIEDAKKQKAQYEGRLEGLMERLKQEFGYTSEEEANVYLEKIEKEIEEGQKILNQGIKRLKEKYVW